MPLTSGIYLLRHFPSNHAMGVDDAEWNMGEVECWPAPETNTKPDELMYRRFLIHPSKAQAGTVNILSIRAGAYLVHTPKGVRAKATSNRAKETLWVAEEVEGQHGKEPVFRFHPFQEPKKFLVLEDPGDEKSTVVLAVPKEEGKSKNSWWKLDSTDMGKKKLADWMSQISDQSMKFSMMSIPGTHQSFALNKGGGNSPFGLENPHCQNRSPYLQLCDGMRFFDLRIDYHEYDNEDKDSLPSLVARHGIHPVAFVWEGYSFCAWLQSIALFLEQHPGETLFARVKLEGQGSCPPKRVAKIFYEDIEPWKDYFYYCDKGVGAANLSLDDCRGKCILFTSDAFKDGAEPLADGRLPPPLNVGKVFNNYKNQKMHRIEGPPEQLSVSEFPNHGKIMTKHIEDATSDKNPEHFYWLGLNSSGKPAIGVATGELYNPIHYTTWVDENWIPQHLDEKKHPKGTRFGLVTFDFYEMVGPFVKFVVERNPGVHV